MKPKNFPGRKNQRRVGALARMEVDRPKKKQTRSEAIVERQQLASIIVDPGAARAVRTKKDRSARGRIART